MSQSSVNQRVLSLRSLACERDERLLFSDLSANFEAGDIVQILGSNGAGKTTLMRIVAGLSDSYTGEVLWNNAPHRGYDFFASVLYFGHATGVKQTLTALENLRWYFGLNGNKNTSAQAIDVSEAQLEAALHKVGLAGYEDVPCHQMSAGQKRRVALARLYCSKAPIWLLDEPFTAIDVGGVQQLEGLIRAHAESGGIVLLTSHQPVNVPNLKTVDINQYRPSRGQKSDMAVGNDD